MAEGSRGSPSAARPTASSAARSVPSPAPSTVRCAVSPSNGRRPLRSGGVTAEAIAARRAAENRREREFDTSFQHKSTLLSGLPGTTLLGRGKATDQPRQESKKLSLKQLALVSGRLSMPRAGRSRGGPVLVTRRPGEPLGLRMEGLLLDGVVPESAAEAAGCNHCTGLMLVRVDGKAIQEAEGVQGVLSQCQGDTVELVFARPRTLKSTDRHDPALVGGGRQLCVGPTPQQEHQPHQQHREVMAGGVCVAACTASEILPPPRRPTTTVRSSSASSRYSAASKGGGVSPSPCLGTCEAATSLRSKLRCREGEQEEKEREAAALRAEVAALRERCEKVEAAEGSLRQRCEAAEAAAAVASKEAVALQHRCTEAEAAAERAREEADEQRDGGEEAGVALRRRCREAEAEGERAKEEAEKLQQRVEELEKQLRAEGQPQVQGTRKAGDEEAIALLKQRCETAEAAAQRAREESEVLKKGRMDADNLIGTCEDELTALRQLSADAESAGERAIQESQQLREEVHRLESVAAEAESLREEVQRLGGIAAEAESLREEVQRL
eukprot:Hpha_TRINITY_DN13337_c0_g1::TRINITY_DN13337_c0_g1_i3::g.95720::m.95720